MSASDIGTMAGDGRYAEESTTQHGAAAFGFPLIEPAVAGAPLEPAQPPLVLADFGAAQGTNSLEPIRRALAALAARAPGRPALVVHADIPGNDFTSLAHTLEESPERYDRDRPGVVPLMAARSLFGPVLPPAGLHFGWTASTLHWLSAAPGPVHGHFFVQLSADAEARRRYADRSAADWRAFLDARAVELVPGAGIVIVDVLMGDDGLMGSEALFHALNGALSEVAAAGRLRPDELDRVVYPTWFRSAAELRAPFAPVHTAPGGEVLELAELRPVTFPDPFAALRDDADAYARAHADFLDGFLGPSFAAALDPARSEAERTAILTEVWAGARRRIAADPARVAPAYRLVTARLRRRP
jgi:SAM dependent carboxyl methyltransferase